MTTDQQRDLRDRVRQAVAGRYGAKAAFCKAAGIDQSNLTKWLNGTWSFGPDSLARIEAQLKGAK